MQTFRKHPMFPLFVLILCTMIILFFVAWLIGGNDCAWWSGCMINLACGCATGMLVYILSNLRTEKQDSLKIQLNALNALNSTFFRIICDARRYTSNAKSLHDSYSDAETIGEIIQNASDAFESALGLDFDVLLELGFDDELTDFPDHLSFGERYELIENDNSEEKINHAIELITEIEDVSSHFRNRLRKPISDRREKLRSMQKTAM